MVNMADIHHIVFPALLDQYFWTTGITSLELLIQLIIYKILILHLLAVLKMDTPSGQRPPAGAMPMARKCCKCYTSPRILALSRCGHAARVCHACTQRFALHRLPIKCPTCDDPYVGFPWIFVAKVINTLQWDAEIEVFNIMTDHQEDNPCTVLHLEAEPLPPVPDQCARCTYGHAIYVSVKEGRTIKLCGQCAITIMEILAGYPIKTPVVTLD